MSCLPSATYAGPGSTDNLWIPVNGSATIRGNLEVTGNAVVDGELRAKGDIAGEANAYVTGSLYGGGLLVPVACPAGVVGGNGPVSQAILPLPLGFNISNGGANSSAVTATSLGGQSLVNFANGIQVQGGSLLAQGSDPITAGVGIGSSTGVGIFFLPPQSGMGSLSAPVVLAPGGALTMNGNKAFVQISGTGSVTITPDPRLGGVGVPSAWNFTSNTGTIQSYFQSTAGGVVTLTSTSGAQTFGVIYL